MYFDAFAHDYISEPLPALVSVLEERLAGLGADNAPANWKDIVPTMKEAAFKLGKPVTRAVLRSVGANLVVNLADELKSGWGRRSRGRTRWILESRARPAGGHEEIQGQPSKFLRSLQTPPVRARP